MRGEGRASMEESGWDLAIVGGGAAGLMAAIFAARSAPPEARIVLLEGSADGGRKILISGGGRCNVLPSRLDPRQYSTASSANTLKKILLSWPLAEQRKFFEDDLGVPLKLEPETGKLFPVSDRARDVRDALVAKAREAGVHLRFGTRLVGLERQEAEPTEWVLQVEAAGKGREELRARRVLLATGGISVPATGSDGLGLRLLEALGHTLHPLYPALTPLLADPPVHADLAGVSLEVTLTAPQERGRPEVRGGFLFTHRGYSGPGVLNLSHWAVRSKASPHPAALRVRWTHDDAEVWAQRLREGAEARGGVSIQSLLVERLPRRLVDRILTEAGVTGDRILARLTREDRQRLSEALGNYRLPWTGDEGARKAEVTGGGVDLSEVDPRTLESRKLPGLFLAGELLDAFGPIGGYNFAWAWATGRLAGEGAAASLWAARPETEPESPRFGS
jgi:predicted Rossmann fold flavoprotein